HGARLYVVNSQPIKLRRQAAVFSQIPEGAEGSLAAFLGGDDSAVAALATDVNLPESWISLRDKLRGEQNLVTIFGSEIRGKALSALVKFGGAIGAKFVCLGDYANSRGAADMGLYPDLLPGYQPVGQSGKLHEEWGGIPNAPGLNLPAMLESAKAGKLKALYVVGANPVGRLGLSPADLVQSFLVVQDMFLTESAAIADVVLPAASAYEKSGTFTNTCGDLQIVKKAGEITAVKSDFEMIVRIADGAGFEVSGLVPFSRGSRADMGQSRGAQSGEADRHSVWLESKGLEPKMSPFDPVAILDEIQRLVPGYDVSRINLLAGNDEHTSLSNSGPGASHDPNFIVPANNDLFSSGTLGRYSRTLNSVMENLHPDPAEAEVAD
ncbi:MAG: molybdopterin oxidoreductase family protein, partial [Terriglobales bacterium]